MNLALAVEKCHIQRALDYLYDFAEQRMCHKCVPCPIATKHALEILNQFSSGEGTIEDFFALKKIAQMMKMVVMCKKGKDAASYLEAILTEHEPEFKEHISGICGPKTCLPLVKFIIIPDKCTACGACKDVCPERAIVGKAPLPYIALSEPFVIQDKKCTRCGRCLPVCEFNAIVLK